MGWVHPLSRLGVTASSGDHAEHASAPFLCAGITVPPAGSRCQAPDGGEPDPGAYESSIPVSRGILNRVPAAAVSLPGNLCREVKAPESAAARRGLGVSATEVVSPPRGLACHGPGVRRGGTGKLAVAVQETPWHLCHEAPVSGMRPGPWHVRDPARPGMLLSRSPSGPRGPAAGSERQRGLAIWLLNIRPCPGSLEGRGKRKRPFLRITE